MESLGQTIRDIVNQLRANHDGHGTLTVTIARPKGISEDNLPALRELIGHHYQIVTRRIVIDEIRLFDDKIVVKAFNS